MQLTISTHQKIINTLIINASFIDNVGLMHGKMGISILFYHLARKYKNKIYEDYAGELIDEIYDEISNKVPLDLENGLAGIGWGIEHLAQNGFIEADTDEVLEEFDNRIYKEFITIPLDNSLLKGLIGLGAYFLKRIKNTGFNNEKETTLTKSLIYIVNELEHETHKNDEIFKEPLNPIKNLHTHNPSNLAITEYPDFKQTTNNEPRTVKYAFDLTWDYPALLWFLSELYEQNIFNFKVENLIKRLTEPLSNEMNLPKLQSNRLLLAFALTKLQKNNSAQPTTNNEAQTFNSVRHGIQIPGEMNSTGRTKPNSKANLFNEQQTKNNTKPSNHSNQVELSNFSNFEKQISNLFSGINRNTINSELPQNNFTFRFGTSGIAWIYNQLHQLTGDEFFKEEVEFWQKLSPSIEDLDAFISIKQQKPDLSLGILEGLAGIWNTTLFQK